MKKISFLLLVLSTALILAEPSHATTSFGQNVREIVKEGRQEGASPAAIRQEVKQEVKERNESLFDRVKNLVKSRLRFDARITGTITSIDGNKLMVQSNDGKTYQVNVISGANLVRRFGGRSTLAEFAVGNTVHVFGKFTNDEKTVIDAKMIRNASVQKRWGAFIGEVTVKNTDNFTFKSVGRADQTAYIKGANFVNRRGEAITYTDIAVGHRVRVKGMWDRSSNQISEVDQVMDFSIPAQPVKN